jgi:5'-nucleotidase
LTTATTGVTTWPPFVSDLQFTNLTEATLREAAQLREGGAEVIVLLAHVGVACESADLATRVVSERDPQGQCSANDELARLLRSLPSGTVDAVVSGHSHSVVHHWMSGVPVVQGEWKGHFLNVIYLPFDRGSREVVRDQIRIEGPVRVCTFVFAAQDDCDGNRPAPPNGRGALVPASFHGRRVVPSERIATLLAATFQRVAALKSRVIARAAMPLRLAHATEAEMGNLVTDAMRDRTAADVAILNAGGIRAALSSGPITYGDVFAALPFDNRIVVLHVSGRELRLLLRVARERGAWVLPGVRSPGDAERLWRELSRGRSQRRRQDRPMGTEPYRPD